MAKRRADNSSKVAKKQSQQDLAGKADAPTKAKQTKEVEQEPALEPAATEPSTSKKGKNVVKQPEVPAAEVEVSVDSGLKKSGKRRKSKAADDAKAVEKKPKEKVDTVKKVSETAKTSERPDEATKKRKAAPMEDKSAGSDAKVKRKRKNSTAVVDDKQTSIKPSEDVPTASIVSPETNTTKKSKASAGSHESPAQPTRKESKKVKAKGSTEVAKITAVAVTEDENVVDVPAAQQEQEFYGFSSDDDGDSSDEDEMADDILGIDVGKLPTIAKDDATVKRKLDKAKRKPTEDRGVVYLGRIPHGFYEDQMRDYFSQFGTVTRLRLSRSKKTGKSKHYGFVEFDSSSVAQIVAETMDNYLLMGCILTCKVIPKDQVHPQLWVGANRKWRVVPRDRIARVAHNKPRTQEKIEKTESRLLHRQEQRKRKLEEAGIEYDFDAVAYKKKPKPTEA